MEYLKEINKEIQDFQTKRIEVVPGLYFNQYETIKTVFFYYNSQFMSGGIDQDGDRKYFYNIVRNPCKIFTKAIDFDTKNIRLLTTGGGEPTKTWFMERDLKYWMRDKQFGKVLNRIFRELPIYGSVVLKIVDGNPYFVDLRNFAVNQGADSLKDSNHITEIHNYSVGEFRKVAKAMGWKKDKVDETIKLFRDMKKASHIRVYERYGDVETQTDNGTKYDYKRVFWADVGNDELDNRGMITAEHKGVELASDDWTFEQTEKLYWEFHKDKIPGRWLGVGVVEELFEPQIKQNEIANLQSKSGAWKSLVLFQTRDTGFNRNLKTGVQNGEVLNVDSELTQVNIADQNGAFFNEETRKWMMNRDELTFSYDAVQGERSPAGTPLGSTQISIAQTLSYFEGIQEEIAMDIKEMLYDVVIPQFEKENNAEHTIRLVGKDLDIYVDMVKNELILKEMIRLSSSGKFPTQEDKDVISVAIEETLKKDKEKLITIPKGFYRGLKYDVDIDITGESVDTRVKSATIFSILQAITADPTALTDPAKRAFLTAYAEQGGINLTEYIGTLKPDPMTAQNPQLSPIAKGSGGGVSAPVGVQPGQPMTV